MPNSLNIDNVVVRPFSANEWPLYKSVRLRALQSDPGVFSSGYEHEAAHPDERWKEGVSHPDVGIFGVFCEGELIGMTGVAVDRNDSTRSTAVLWGSWLEKNWRGKGLSKKMYDARVNWVKQRPFLKKIVVAHRESNVASKKANQKHGFVFTRMADYMWPDGKSEQQYFYELKI